ncbi:28 kDa heat- and acid-stable phosphoprotein-like [Zingiber officinale]|uniref:28 kDa heat- and acid-stable phosphoprotein-like n=1 Tax=Zingiber officinale TaxID=94328 RepID=UPI001C4B356B|nr:28 kDa heat- and acid-stable phosphoprotein-like [Zingiber officinale]
MGRGRFKAKPTGRRNFSTPEEMASGSSARPRTFKQVQVEVEDNEEDESEEESDDSEDGTEKKKGILDISEIQNPNLIKPKNVKARTADVENTPELSRREREEIEKQKAHERYMMATEQGKTEQARKDLERLALIRQQRAEAAKKREEEKTAKEQKRVEARK